MSHEPHISSPAIGVISDTHGLLRPGVLDIFRGTSLILHAGDIGSSDILKQLEAIAPVTAVSGNMDRGILATFLNDTETIEFSGFKFHLLHDLTHLSITPSSSGVHAVISGHTHMPQLRNDNDIIYLNPGSAGPERSGKPVSVAKITVRDGRLWAKHYYL